jgi:hypothetical protein
MSIFDRLRELFSRKSSPDPSTTASGAGVATTSDKDMRDADQSGAGGFGGDAGGGDGGGGGGGDGGVG